MKFMMTWVALVFAMAANAQTVDLNNLPKNFSFVSRGDDGITTMTFLERDGDRFHFVEETDNSLGSASIRDVWVNRNSQTVRVESSTIDQRYGPHDCAPFIGNCIFIIMSENGNNQVANRSTFLVGDVWVDRLRLIIAGESVFYSKSCTTVDEFGFWINFVSEGFDGRKRFGERIFSSVKPKKTTSLRELQAMCSDAEELVS